MEKKYCDNLVDISIRQAQKHGDKPLYRFIDHHTHVERTLSFSQLDQLARQWQYGLGSYGVVPGNRALLLFGHEPNYITSFWGCLYAGVVAVPVFPPKIHKSKELKRLITIIEDCRPAIILTSEYFLPTAQHIQAELVQRGSEIAIVLADEIEPSPPIDTTPYTPSGRDLAFLQYTSGSTGSPKGVMVDHDNLMANETAIANSFAATPDDILFSWLPFYHDMGLIGCVIQPLYCGATVVLMSPMHFLQSPINWLRGISSYRATIMVGPNFAFEHCCEKISSVDLADIDLSCVRMVVNGSEPISPASMERFTHYFWQTGFKPHRFSPSYGLAEATLLVSCHPATRPLKLIEVSQNALQKNCIESPQCDRDTLTLAANGAVIDGHEVAIVDANTHTRCEDGRVGEVWVAGPSVSRGYWQKPERNQADFNLCIDGSSARFMRSGDYGFIRDDQLFITGREKELIIIRGRNFYPQDLEKAIERQVAYIQRGRLVAFSAVGDGGERLIIVAEPNRQGIRLKDFDSIAQRCALALSTEMGIAADEIIIAKLGTIGKTSSGKTQRAHCKLRYQADDIEAYARFLRKTEVAPRNDGFDLASTDGCATFLTGQIATIAAVDPSLLDSNLPLHDLGLDSMHIAELVKVIHLETGYSVGIEQILTGATIASLAQALAQSDQNKLKTDASSPQQTTAQLQKTAQLHKTAQPQTTPETQVVQSFQQQRLWFLQQLNPGTTLHNLVIELQLGDVIDREKLNSSLRTLVARHEILRTVFTSENGKPQQRVLEKMPLDFVVETGSTTDLHKARRELIHHMFDLSRGPLWKVRLLFAVERENRLLIAFHHIIFDGVSANIFCRELAILYSGQASLPPMAHQYRDYAVWQQNQVDQGVWQAQLKYWRKRLHQSRAATLCEKGKEPSAMGKEPSAMGKEASTLPLTLAKDTHADIKSFAKQHQLTPFMVLLGAFYTALHYRTGETDLTVGTDTANRPLYQWQHQLGFFVNQLALRLHLDATKSVKAFYADLRHHTLTAYRHQSYPFDQLVSALNPPRAGHNPPFFSTKLVWQRLELESLAASGLCRGEVNRGDIQVHQSTAEFDLVLDFVESKLGLSALIKFNPGRLSAAQVEHFAQLFSLALHTQLCDSAQTIQQVKQRLSQWEVERLRTRGSNPRPMLKRHRRRMGIPA